MAMNKNAFNRLALVISCDLLFFATTDPRTASPPILIISCALTTVTVYLVCRLAMELVGKLFDLSTPTKKHAAVSITIALTFLILMQSIGQLSSRDILAVVPLAVVSYFYLSYVFRPERQK
jgi:hypothetical protein